MLFDTVNVTLIVYTRHRRQARISKAQVNTEDIRFQYIRTLVTNIDT